MASIVWPIILGLNAVVIILLAVFVLWKIHKERKSGYPLQDERTSMLNGKVAIGALWISYAFMISLLLWTILGTEFLVLPELEAGWTIIAVMFVASISNALLRWHYGRKGEV
jgi:hypothetical protein